MAKHVGEPEKKGRRIPVKETPEGGLRPDEAPEEGWPDAEGAAAAGPAGAETIGGELEKARAEAGEFQDKYLRLYAETENFKKRMARESAERQKYYNEGILRELLPVIDNLERAIAHAEENGEGGGLVEGVKMVHRQFKDTLAKFGVTEVESVGQPFDPEKQQAVMQVENGEHEEGTVVDEMQKGYFLHDRILRPAMVTVSKRPASEHENETE